MEQHCAWKLWVIEYAWAHNMIDVFQDVRALYWPDGDWGILSLDESWHVRVVSAQVYNIIKGRQTHHYEKVLAFLEHTHTLLPTLVPAIKHMKIVFGLKTMVIMWMLREGIGPISVVQKIMNYFPSKLPQYEEHCREYEMFLMRRNQLDFRTFAQSLVMDKEKLQDYIQNHVEEQYGDHYAQKTEERLLHYLRELDKALPKCTYIDKIMKKKSPVKEWEKALLGLITDDCITTATSLKTLLQSDATCYSLSKSHLGTRTATCLFPESHVGTSKEQLQPAADKFLELDPPVTDIMVNNGKEPVFGLQTGHRNQTTRASATGTEDENRSIEVSPHFCSKHQRWVRNILSECPGESSEQQPLQEISPPLFTPPSSSSSSSDLTPSNLTSPPEHHLSTPTSNQLQETEEDPKIVEKHVSEPVDLGPPLHPASLAAQSLIPGGRVLKVVIVPCSDVTPVTVYPVKSSSTPNDLQVCNNEDSTAASSILSNSAKPSMQPTVTSSKPFISKLSRRFRLSQRFSQSQKLDCHNKEENGAKKVACSPQMSFANTGGAARLSTHSTCRIDVSNNTQTYTQSHSSCTDHMASSHDRTTFNNNHLQPRVVLKRMSTEECLQVTERRLQSRQRDGAEECRDPVVSAFDINFLYSDSSSEEESDSDIEYRPSRKTLRRWSRGLLPF